MIFVTFGNSPAPFTRLAEKIEEIAGRYNEKFVVQCGSTKFPFDYSEAYNTITHSKMIQFIKDASLIISHGGYGTISECLRLGKKVIAVPRILGKEVNHSQEELVKKLEVYGYLLGVYNVDDLEDTLQYAQEFNPKTLSERNNAGRFINEFIETMLEKK